MPASKPTPYGTTAYNVRSADPLNPFANRRARLPHGEPVVKSFIDSLEPPPPTSKDRRAAPRRGLHRVAETELKSGMSG